jgi:hypothetical protein
VVSSADVLMLVVWELVVILNGPWLPIGLGRHGSDRSDVHNVEGNLPCTNMWRAMVRLFRSKGIMVWENVMLEGGHTVGFSHYIEFTGRMYSLRGARDEWEYPPTRVFIQQYPENHISFFENFAAVMQRLGAVGVKTERQGLSEAAAATHSTDRPTGTASCCCCAAFTYCIVLVRVTMIILGLVGSELQK